MTEQEITGLGIWEHINELRKRLFKAMLGLIAATIVSFSLAPMLIEFLARPIGGTEKLISIEVTENISTFMRVSLLSGFIIALPIIFYQIWAFISPGLMPNEKRWMMLAIPFATLLFVSGVAFANFVMLPTALPFLISFMGITTTPRLINYFNFVTNLLFWVGICFEAPLVVFILAKLGLVTAGGLVEAVAHRHCGHCHCGSGGHTHRRPCEYGFADAASDRALPAQHPVCCDCTA
jgi:sec-independent protein translocase protein TatC